MRMEHLVRPLLSQDQIDSIYQHLSAADLPWRDGRLTAGEQAASVKKNLQLDPESPLAIQIVNKVSEALKADPLIKSFALIRKVHSVLISRCGPVMDTGGMWIIRFPAMAGATYLSPSF